MGPVATELFKRIDAGWNPEPLEPEDELRRRRVHLEIARNMEKEAPFAEDRVQAARYVDALERRIKILEDVCLQRIF